MVNFTLKIYRDKEQNTYYINDSHYNGGIDLQQRMAWNHIFPNSIFVYELELIYWMADMHSWKVEITEI